MNTELIRVPPFVGKWPNDRLFSVSSALEQLTAHPGWHELWGVMDEYALPKRVQLDDLRDKAVGGEFSRDQLAKAAELRGYLAAMKELREVSDNIVGYAQRRAHRVETAHNTQTGSVSRGGF